MVVLRQFSCNLHAGHEMLREVWLLSGKHVKYSKDAVSFIAGFRNLGKAELGRAQNIGKSNFHPPPSAGACGLCSFCSFCPPVAGAKMQGNAQPSLLRLLQQGGYEAWVEELKQAGPRGQYGAPRSSSLPFSLPDCTFIVLHTQFSFFCLPNIFPKFLVGSLLMNPLVCSLQTLPRSTRLSVSSEIV